MIKPQLTSAARCRRSVAGAMPCARSASCWLDGKNDQIVAAQYGFGMEAEQRVEHRQRGASDTPIRALAMHIARNICHLCATFSGGRLWRSPGLPHGRAKTFGARRASLINAVPFPLPRLGKEKLLAESAQNRRQKLLTVIRRSGILKLSRYEKGFRNSVSGLFLLPLLLLSLKSKMNPAARRAATHLGPVIRPDCRPPLVSSP